jgi:hypothetical protein
LPLSFGSLALLLLFAGSLEVNESDESDEEMPSIESTDLRLESELYELSDVDRDESTPGLAVDEFDDDVGDKFEERYDGDFEAADDDDDDENKDEDENMDEEDEDERRLDTDGLVMLMSTLIGAVERILFKTV